MDKDKNILQNTLSFTVMPRLDSKFVAPSRLSASFARSRPAPPGITVNPSSPPIPVKGDTVVKKFSFKPLLQVGTVLIFGAIFVSAGYFGWSWWKERSTSQMNAVDAPIETANPPPPVLPLPPENPPPPEDDRSLWLQKYFGISNCAAQDACSDNADPDKDGLSNEHERLLQTDPNNADGDSDGLADGDEVNIFGGSPLNAKTAGSDKYTDADDAKGGYNSAEAGSEMTSEKIIVIAGKIKQFGLHQPSLITLLGFLSKYGAGGDEGGVTSIDVTPEAKLERDMQRVNTMKKIGIALEKYFASVGSYPPGNFTEMLVKIRPYNLVATNFSDPINKTPFIYAYEAKDENKDFTLSYHSETQNQPIKYGRQQAIRDAGVDAATASDEKKIIDLENLRQALLVYLAAKIAGEERATYPGASELEGALVPAYLQALPTDEKTGKVYEYLVSTDRSGFIVSAELTNPPAGSTRYVCDPAGCVSD